MGQFVGSRVGTIGEDGWMVLQVPSSFMNDIDEACLIHGKVMGGLPGVLVRQFGPVVYRFKVIFT